MTNTGPKLELAREAPSILRHPKGYVAQERAAGRRHLHLTGGRSRWYLGRDFGGRDNGECGRRPVKADAGRADQIRSQDFHRRPRFAGTGQGFDEWAESHV